MAICFTENLRAVAPDLYLYFLMCSIREKGLPCGKIDCKSPASSSCIKRFSPQLRVFFATMRILAESAYATKL